MMSDITQENKMSVRDFVDAADAKGNFCTAKRRCDSSVLAHLFFNIELMNQQKEGGIEQ